MAELAALAKRIEELRDRLAARGLRSQILDMPALRAGLHPATASLTEKMLALLQAPDPDDAESATQPLFQAKHPPQ